MSLDRAGNRTLVKVAMLAVGLWAAPVPPTRLLRDRVFG